MGRTEHGGPASNRGWGVRCPRPPCLCSTGDDDRRDKVPKVLVHSHLWGSGSCLEPLPTSPGLFLYTRRVTKVLLRGLVGKTLCENLATQETRGRSLAVLGKALSELGQPATAYEPPTMCKTLECVLGMRLLLSQLVGTPTGLSVVRTQLLKHQGLVLLRGRVA